MDDPKAIEKLKKLSKRELEVMILVCDGFLYKEIAQMLHFSVSTVKTHMGHIYVKLGIDQLPRSARLFALGKTYCQVLRNMDIETPDPEEMGKENIPEPVSREIIQIVEEDDGGALIVSPENSLEPIFIDETKNKQIPRRRPNPVMTGFMIIAMISILFTGYSIFNRFFSTPPASPPSSTEQPAQSEGEEASMAESQPEPVAEVQSSPTDTVQPTPKATARPKPDVLFEDNFDQGLSDEWEVVMGNPIVVNGMLSSDQDTWILVGDPEWTDYSVEFIAETASNWFNWGFNVTGIRVIDIGNMFAYKWTTEQTEWHVVDNGNWSILPQSSTRLGGNMKNFKFDVKGNSVTFYIDGVKAYSFFNDKFPQGRVGLKVAKDTVIDNFKIREILE